MFPPEKALKGRYPDITLSGLILLICLIDRALPYPIAIALSGFTYDTKSLFLYRFVY